MRTRVKKHKLGSTKPASQLFLFSDDLNKAIDSYFSGNVIIEIELDGYNYKYHEEAKQVVDFMNIHCKSRGIKAYKFLTVVLNYKLTGLSLAKLSGDYDYPFAIHDSLGYKQLATLHEAYNTLQHCLNSFNVYSNHTLRYANVAKYDPIKLPQRTATSLKNQLNRTEQSILKSMSSVIDTLHKLFQPTYHR